MDLKVINTMKFQYNLDFSTLGVQNVLGVFLLQNVDILVC